MDKAQRGIGTKAQSGIPECIPLSVDQAKSRRNLIGNSSPGPFSYQEKGSAFP